MSEDDLFLNVSEAGAEDFEAVDEMFIVTTPPDLLFAVKEKIETLGAKVEDASFDMIPKVFIDCDAETTKANEALIEWLEALDDVDAVYHNMKTPE